MRISRVVILAGCALSFGALAKEFVVELDPQTAVKPGTTDGVRTVEGFSTADKTYAIYQADSTDALAMYLQRAGLSPKKVTAVKDVNSPVRGGGKPAGDQPRAGQKTFVIERKIPGVGTFPDARKEAISKKSNAEVAQIGDSIEWVHSYLTDEGTYCVYRATDEETIRKHGAVAGAPISRVSEARPAVASH